MSLSERVQSAVRDARAAGLLLHHLAVAPSDWPLAFPRVDLRPAPRSSATVLWAYDAHRHKLVPFVIGGAA